MHSTRRIDEESRVSECALFPYDVPAFSRSSNRKRGRLFSLHQISPAKCVFARTGVRQKMGLPQEITIAPTRKLKNGISEKAEVRDLKTGHARKI